MQCEFSFDRQSAEVDRFVAVVKLDGWLTRRELKERCGWDDRTVRALAEAAGPEIVRGQRGFNHVENCTVDEMNHAANQAISQAKKMMRAGIRWKRQAHAAIG